MPSELDELLAMHLALTVCFLESTDPSRPRCPAASVTAESSTEVDLYPELNYPGYHPS